ncbi:glycosyltransferase family 8 protein [Pisolithus croceorrhizus]|nr:glycosyltransferase family 8 protein [Pisolithus croceorrhizus]
MSLDRQAAYVTLLTKSSYFPAVLVLDYTLRSVGSCYPLVVMVTASLPQECRYVLTGRGIRLRDIANLEALEGVHSLAHHDTRFHDTWTKLRVFELVEFKRVVLLDADMIVMRNMDELFDIELPADTIAATHVCACNPRRLPHYPSDWIPANCAYTPLVHPSGLTSPTKITDNSPRPHTQLNSGLVVLRPSLELAHAVYNHLNTSPLVSTWSFPDQDLLADFFKGRWEPLPWNYNALKTLMIIHKPLWRDEEIKCLHYILADKPWHARVSQDGRGEYDKCNQWWWDRFEEMVVKMQENGEDWELVMANVAK